MPVDLSALAPHLERAPGGRIWVTRSQSAISYPDEGNEQCFAVEDGSFWFEHRNRCIVQLLQRFPPPGVFFDIGGGNGFVARALQESGHEVVLLEPGAAGVEHALARGVEHIVRGTLADAGLPADTVAAAGLFDVLEHIADDRAFLATVNRAQPPGGRLYITAPALPFLWSREDEFAGHYRRYSLRKLTALVHSAGYDIEYATYFFAFLAVPIFFLRTLPGWLGLGLKAETTATVQADHEFKSSLAQKLLDHLTSREAARLARGSRSRIGGSCLLVARKASR